MSPTSRFAPTRRDLFRLAAAVAIATQSLLAREPGRPPATRLPLGPSSLNEERVDREVGQGLTYTHIVRGQASPEDAWTLRVMLPSREVEGGIDPDAPAGMLGSSATAAAVVSKLESLGWQPRMRPFATPALPDDVSAHDIGYAVSVGRGATGEALAADERRLREQGFRTRRWHTSFDGDETTGPWDLHVLTVDPRAWSVASSPGESLVGRETVKAIAARAGAIAAVNGGFFAMQPFDPASGRGDGEPGEAAGIAILDGQLVSEATAGRPAVLFHDGGRQVRIDRFTTRLSLEGPFGRRALDGLNRVPGVIRNCGGSGGDIPTERPAHDQTCTDPSEIIAFTPNGLSRLPTGPGVEVVLNAAGVVTAVQDRSGAIPSSWRPASAGRVTTPSAGRLRNDGPTPSGAGWVLQATGDEADWLRRQARVGMKLFVRRTVVDSHGSPVALMHGDCAVNGGPMLVAHGAVVIDADRDGLVRHEPGVDNFFFGWVRQRNPRTMVGVDARGRVLLVAVDGRQAGHSAGLSILEAAQVMRALGAVTAMNLDGGGSTTMVVEGRVVNRPSDPGGEREDGDAVLVAPRRR
jgi:hypothetical protein